MLQIRFWLNISSIAEIVVVPATTIGFGFIISLTFTPPKTRKAGFYRELKNFNLLPD